MKGNCYAFGEILNQNPQTHLTPRISEVETAGADMIQPASGPGLVKEMEWVAADSTAGRDIVESDEGQGRQRNYQSFSY